MTTHKHHIIPKYMGGTDDPSNLIELSIEDHALAHKKLWEEHGNRKDFLAWQGLSKMLGKEEIIKELLSLTHKGKPKSEEHKKKIGLAQIGKPKHSDSVKKIIGSKSKGRKWSEESKQKKRLSMLGNSIGKANIGNTNRLGKFHSIETKEKMKKSQLRRRELERQKGTL